MSGFGSGSPRWRILYDPAGVRHRSPAVSDYNNNGRRCLERPVSQPIRGRHPTFQIENMVRTGPQLQDLHPNLY